MPLVTVIIPVYNRENTIKMSLKSLLNQTLKDIEIIVVDDASTDRTSEILKQFSDRITIIRNEENMGAAISRNKGLEIANGVYIGFLDSDDIIEPKYYEKLYKTAKRTRADMVVGLITGFEDIKEISSHISNKNSYRTIPQKYKNKYAFITSQSACDKLFKKNLISGLRFPETKSLEDYAFSKIASFNADVIAVSSAKYFYFYNQFGNVQNQWNDLRQHLKDIFLIADYIKENTQDELNTETDEKFIRLSQLLLVVSKALEILHHEEYKEVCHQVINFLLKKASAKYGNWKEVIDYMIIYSPDEIYMMHAIDELVRIEASVDESLEFYRKKPGT